MNNIFMRDNALASAKCACIQCPSKHKGKSTYPEAEHSDAIYHEVHSHNMGGILLLGKTGFNECKTSLHKHYEEPGNQGPHNIYTDLIVSIGCADCLYSCSEFAYT